MQRKAEGLGNIEMEYQILNSQEADAAEILQQQYDDYQREAEIHGDFTIQPLMQTLDELVSEYQKGVVLKSVKGKVV